MKIPLVLEGYCYVKHIFPSSHVLVDLRLYIGGCTSQVVGQKGLSPVKSFACTVRKVKVVRFGRG